MKIFMQPFLLCIMVLSMAVSNAQQVKPPVQPGTPQSENQQTTEDDPQWMKVDSLLQAGLPQSALDEIRRLEAGAAKTLTGVPDYEAQYVQYIKATLYELYARSFYEENYLINYIAEAEEQLGKPWPSPLVTDKINKITFSVLADLYWQYYTQNRWMILDRTASQSGSMDENAPIDTWDAHMFIKKVSDYYLRSLDKSFATRRIMLKDFDPVLVNAEGSKLYRPTLFDFLAHRAVDFFMNEEASITTPVYRFVMKDPLLMSASEKFTTLDISSEDTLSFHFRALKILQELEKFHLNDQNPEALVDVELKRLRFVHTRLNHPQKDSLYINTLLALEKKYTGHVASAFVMEAIANWYAEEYQPPVKIYSSTLPEPKKADFTRAREWCLRVIQKYPGTNSAANCRITLRNIESKQIELRLQQELITKKEFPLLVRYKNINKVYFKLLPSEFIPNREYYGERDAMLKKLIAIKPVMSWSAAVPEFKDYQMHQTELIMPEMPAGQYILLASANEKPGLNDSVLAYSYIQLSNMAYISRNAPDGSGLMYILDRSNGKPLPGVKVQSFTTDYDYTTRKYKRHNREKYVTGEDGSFTIKAPLANQNANLSFELNYRNETLFIENYYQLYDRGRYRDRENRITTFFFTDRAIYRPGQAVYFKGIVVDKSGKAPVVVPNHHSTVRLFDVNGQNVSTQELTSNEFGSFSGSFMLPASMLTGSMRIESENGAMNFNVEEYKRPTFEVTFKPVDSTYKLSTPVNIAGKAATYTDVALAGALVNYRVVRNVIYPFRDVYFIWPPNRNPDAEIANGTVKTDKDGNFTINFTAVPDPDEYIDSDPVYTFMVYADVTDISGETRSAVTSVSISNKAMLLETNLDPELNISDLKPVTVKATNLAGKSIPATVKLELYKVKEGELLIPRVWDLPDTVVYSRNEFRSRLPEFPYFDETMPGEYGKDPVTKDVIKEKLVYSSTLNTATDTVHEFKGLDAEPGRYVLVLASTDAFGEKVSIEKLVTLYNPSTKKIPSPMHLWFTVLTKEPLKGDKLKFLAGSSVNGKLLIEVQADGKILKHEWYTAGGQKEYEIQLPDSLSGRVTLLANLVWNNTNFMEMHDFDIADKSKELTFSFETFKSTLLPGGIEKWKIKITDNNGKPVNAELLAGMYDASLDAFMKHQWYFDLFRAWPLMYNWEFQRAFEMTGSMGIQPPYYGDPYHYQEYDMLNWFGYNSFNHNGARWLSKGGMLRTDAVMAEAEVVEMTDQNIAVVPESNGSNKLPPATTPADQGMRKNLQETAFFYPQLATNKDGEVWIEFTVPEALTRWNFMGLAHTTDLKNKMFSKQVVTRKEVMVTPNLPRFFREGDKMIIKAKIDNLTANPIQGVARIEILDALTQQPVSAQFGLSAGETAFSADVRSSTAIQWEVTVPEGIQAVMVRISASAGNHSDGQEVMLPVLVNRMLVTETLPLWINGKGSKKFTFNRLLSKPTATLKPQKLTLEFTSNPAWYALQALPWLESAESENSDQIFNRYFANSIAGYVANSSPKIRSVFESWKAQSPEALVSNLEKNQELKSLILEETPWLAEARNESEQMQRLALMFDLNRLAAEKTGALRQLMQKQSANGGWPWFEGMPESRYITQWITTGMGKLNYLKVIDLRNDNQSMQMVQRAVNYLGERLREDYERILRDSTGTANNSKDKKARTNVLNSDHLGYEQIQFLYAMSYLMDVVQPQENAKEAVTYFSEQARKYWNKKSLYAQGMIALWAGRSGDAKTLQAILASLREKSITSEELGTYWRDNSGGYYWYQAPIETQALMIELFEEAGSKTEVDRMKTWLLKQKQTQSWPTSTATTEAVYALLLRGSDWLQPYPEVIIRTGTEMIEPNGKIRIPGSEVNQGTGYFKTSWTGSDITSDKGNILVVKESDGPAWGAMYYQYFENLDKITPAATPLKIRKQLYIKENTAAGPALVAVTPERKLHVGDQVTVKIEISTDRNLEYVHLKDMRAAALEPGTTISGYEWKGGLGYYESTRDASTNFFFYYLPKGTHIFEYNLVIFQAGEYSNGISTIQCMYAPEFAAHSEGIRIQVEPAVK